MNGTRRSLLAGVAGSTAAALAGCLGVGDDDESSFESHPSTDGIEGQPTLGTLDAPGAVVAFEDPSCRSCRRFETETFPQLKAELVDPGEAAFVYRTLDITFPWAEPASQVMASTFDAAADAFWSLKAHYYEEQSGFDTDNVFERSRAFLEEATSVDAEAVVTAARNAEHDELIRSNREAAEAVGVDSTPQFYLFRDGEFRTEVAGPQDYDVFASALGFQS